MKHFLDIESLSDSVVEQLVNTAYQMKTTQYRSQDLEHKTIGLIFEKPSLRTRVSFEVGIQQLGGQSVVLLKDEIGLGKREAIKDIARVLSRYLDIVMIRTFDHRNLQEYADASSISLINGLSDQAHPCQAVADMLTIYEKFDSFTDLKLVYLGDYNNVSRSLAQICSKLKINCVISSPVFSHESNNSIMYEKDPILAVKDADIIYTDTWVSMGNEAENINFESLIPYQVNDQLLRYAKKEAIIMHCLPAHRGEEITESVIESANCVVFDQAENRLHAQKAILQYLIN